MVSIFLVVRGFSRKEQKNWMRLYLCLNEMLEHDLLGLLVKFKCHFTVHVSILLMSHVLLWLLRPWMLLIPFLFSSSQRIFPVWKESSISIFVPVYKKGLQYWDPQAKWEYRAMVTRSWVWNSAKKTWSLSLD